MARPEGFEPPTLCLEGRRSIQLSYGRVVVLILEYLSSEVMTLTCYLLSRCQGVGSATSRQGRSAVTSPATVTTFFSFAASIGATGIGISVQIDVLVA